MDVQAVAGPSSRPYGDSTASSVVVTTTNHQQLHPGSSISTVQHVQSRSGDVEMITVNGHTDVGMDGQAQIVETKTVFHTTAPMIKRFRTGYCYDPTMTLHKYNADPDDPEDSHPEVPERIEQSAGGRDLARMQKIAVRQAVKEEVMLVHTEELWHRVNSFEVQHPDFYTLNKDLFQRLSLYVNEHSALCARMSLGGVIETCRAVAEGQIQNAFAIVRPPGHHAEPEAAMGFCFYNNVAVAAEYLKAIYPDIKKVLILDWDVHHGNGTQKAFWTDPDVLYISLHLYENGQFYPGGTYGDLSMCGQGPGRGRSVNIPWDDPGMGDADYIYAFQKIVMPIAYEFAPDFVIVSAGFDAARGDHLGRCDVTPEGYAHMTHMLSALAGGKVVVALEGGYNVESVAQSALSCIKVLLGEIPPVLDSMVASSSATMVVHQVAQQQSKYWKSIRPTYQPKEEYKDVADVVPLSEILKAHRTYHLYHELGMYNIPISDPVLEERFKDQMLVSDNIFKEVDTVVILVHDMGNVRAELHAMEANVNLENSFLIDTSTRILRWVLENGWALIDVNILPHSERIRGLKAHEIAQQEYYFVRHVWLHIIQMASNITNVVFIGQSSGCNAIVRLLNNHFTDLDSDCERRVKVAVQLFDMHPPARLASNSEVPGLRRWFYERSLAIFPAEHMLLEDSIDFGKRYGRAEISEDTRPTHSLHNNWLKIQQFILSKVPSKTNLLPSQAQLRDVIQIA